MAILYYMVKVVCVEDKDVHDSIDLWLGLFVLITIGKQFHIEVHQLINGEEEGAAASYFMNPMNIMDIVQNILSVLLVFFTMF